MADERTVSLSKQGIVETARMDVSVEVEIEPTAVSKPLVAGYDLVRVIGKGGMGVVWEATEHRFDRKVALKVQKKVITRDDDMNELWSEAYVAARIGDPGIIRVHDVGFTLDDQPYYTMDFVEGSELAAVIAEGPIAPRRAIEIAIDIARAVAAAHEHGIVHCDLKPRNVLIDASGRARVLDFGIAHSSKTGNRRLDGKMVGSPPYMAPEQVTGSSVGPETDVHAIGVMLYEMLSGKRPYQGDKADKVLEKVALEMAPSLREISPFVHEDVAQLVETCLAKKKEDRYASGRALLELLSAVAEGRPLTEVTAAPGMSYVPRAGSTRPPTEKPRREEAKKHFKWSWKMKSPPEVLWPWVANTDRFNKTIGLQTVDFVDLLTSEGTSQRTGKMRTLGMNIEWREFPFEWVKDREHSVFRWYRAGPISALWNRMRLTPTEDGGSELTHEIWIMPRGLLGQIATFVEVSQKAGRNMDRTYRKLDEAIASGTLGDPYEGLYVATEEQRDVVIEGLGQVESEGFPHDLVKKAQEHLLTSPSQVLAVMRPYEIADAWGVDRAEVLDLFLHAAHVGLLDPAWDVICPKCLLAHESKGELAKVTRVGTCDACVNTYERDLAESVELVFRPHHRVRETERVTYCAGAPSMRPHVLVQQVLDAGESRTVTVRLPRGTYRAVAAFAKGEAELVSSAVGYESSMTIAVTNDDVIARPSTVRAGEVTITLHNDTDHEQTIRLEIPGARKDGVTAATAMTHPTFRELFGDELLAPGEHLNVGRMAFMFVEAEERGRMFTELGDARACELFAELDAIVRREIDGQEGSVVPASLELSVGAFSQGHRAAAAAMAIARVARERIPKLSIRLAVHEGRCLALTRGDRVEYFGQTLHRGVSLLADAPPFGIAMSATLSADRKVASLIHQTGLASTVVQSARGPYKGRRVMVVFLKPVTSASELPAARAPMPSIAEQ